MIPVVNKPMMETSWTCCAGTDHRLVTLLHFGRN